MRLITLLIVKCPNHTFSADSRFGDVSVEVDSDCEVLCS